VASFSHSVTVPRPPAEVFPWLFEAERVPQWTDRLEAYEVLGDGALGAGARVRQVLRVGGERLDVEMELVAYDPPRSAESRFSIHGLDVVTTYSLAAAAGGGTELTQVLEGKATSFKARMLVPVVQPRLERKLTEDLERLRGILSA
jgi:uncharacterized protein YndB with AHSA1/START domain